MGDYIETFLPQAGEEKPAYLGRMESLVKSRSGHDRALAKACQALAVIWDSLDGMENPFVAKASGDIASDRDILETAVMADGVKKALSKLDALQDPEQQIQAALRKHGGELKGPQAKAVKTMVTKQVRSAHAGAILGALAEAKEPFDAVMELQNKEELDPQIGQTLDKLKHLYKDFKETRRQLLEARKKN